ncbi:MAG: DMT family transporter [Coriobacteriales bacterium]|nr:DMT family transporter [Coriobacteriales bacterium]
MSKEDATRSDLMSKSWVVAALAILCCALWGSAFAFVKTGYELFEIPVNNRPGQVLFAGMRFALAGMLVLAGTAAIRRRAPLPTKQDVLPIILLGLSQTTLQYAPFYMGLAYASGTNSSLVQGMSAFVQIALATLVFRQERLTVRKLVGCMLGIGGVAIVTLRAGGFMGAWSPLGEGLIFASVVMGGCAACLMRRYGVSGDPLMLTGWQFLCGGLALAIIGLAFGGQVHAVSPAACGVLVYLGTLSAVAFSLWSLLLKYNPVSRVAVFRPFIPMFGVVFSVALLGERIPLEQLPRLALALALIMAGTLVVNTEGSRRS